MKKQTVLKKLRNYPQSLTLNGSKQRFESSRFPGRCVFVYRASSSEDVVCIPVVIESDGNERVAFHAKTIKSLVDFLEGR
jgi:hypothetical protein